MTVSDDRSSRAGAPDDRADLADRAGGPAPEECLDELLDRQSEALDRLERLSDAEGLPGEDRLRARAGLLAELEPIAQRIAKLRAGVDPLGPRALAIEQAHSRYEGLRARWAQEASRLHARRDEVSRRLHGVGSGRRAITAYGGGDRGPRFQDRTG